MKIILTIIPMLLAAYSAKAADPAPTPTPIGPISYRVANNPLFGKPSPSPKPAPKKAQAQRESRDGTIGQSALGLRLGGQLQPDAIASRLRWQERWQSAAAGACTRRSCNENGKPESGSSKGQRLLAYDAPPRFRSKPATTS